MLAYPRLVVVFLISLAIGCGGSAPMTNNGSGGAGSGGASGGSGGTGPGGTDASSDVASPDVESTDVAGPDIDDDAPDGSGTDAGLDASAADASIDRGPPVNPISGACTPVVEQHVDEGAFHIVQCSPTNYLTRPPSSGNHYPIWPAYRIYDQPVPWGFLMHGMEHGAVVITYRCDDGCADQVAQLKALVAAIPADDFCATPKRIVLTPDPTLDIAFAASAWTWTYRASCFDGPSLSQFVADHYNQGPEKNICSSGIDLSETGWCP